MSKTEKTKVPKITEEEYTKYVNRLRELSEGKSKNEETRACVAQASGEENKQAK